jgi:hypothetical protein
MKTDIKISSGIRAHDPSFWAGEDISCLSAAAVIGYTVIMC